LNTLIIGQDGHIPKFQLLSDNQEMCVRVIRAIVFSILATSISSCTPRIRSAIADVDTSVPISYSTGTEDSYSFDPGKVELANGMARLKTPGQTDDESSASGFGGGTLLGVIRDGAGYVRIAQTAAATNTAELDSSWAPKWPNLKGYWKLNEAAGALTAADSSSSAANPGTPTAVAFNATGKLGKAADFNGSTSVISVSAASSLHPASALTVSAWFKTDDTTLTQQRIISTTEFGGYQLSLNETGACPGNSLCFAVQLGGSYRSVTFPASNLSNNVWYHAVGTYDGSTVKLYLNGLSVGTPLSMPGPIGYRHGGKHWHL
jgi:hypothetical protein